METLIELQNRIYNQNVAMGWHDNPRSFNTFICLFHSELSEAMEGLRKNLMDDHLPEYPMAAVELADFVIRVLDWFGTQDGVDAQQIVTVQYYGWDKIDYLAELHQLVSAAKYYAGVDDAQEQLVESLNQSISVANSMAQSSNWPLVDIINKKLEYNKHRADHKRENRAETNGKKF